MYNILVISEKYYPFSGAELVIHEVVKILARQGFKITVATGSKRIHKVEGVNYFYFPILNVGSKIALWKNIGFYGSYFDKWIPYYDAVYIPRLSYPIIPRAKKRGRKVVVHLLDLQPVDYGAIIYHPYESYKHNILSRIKKSVSDELQEYQSTHRAVASGFMTPINGFCAPWLSDADSVICECNRTAYIVGKEIPALISKLRIIGNPLPDIPFIDKELNINRSFIYGGGTLYSKGIKTLIEASLRIHRKHPSSKFILTRISDAKWKSLLAKLNRNLNNPFVVLGSLSHDAFLGLHRSVSALVMPTLIEEFPMVILESMLAGTIPVASKTGGIPEMVQGTFAEKTLFTPGNADELADRIELVLSLSREQLKDIGAQLKIEVMKKYDHEDIADKLIRVFEA